MSMSPIIKNNFKHLFIKLFLMFLFYFSLSALTSILFLPFENLASLPLLFSLSASLPLSRVCCCLIPIADLARSLSFVVVVVFFFGCVCVCFLVAVDFLAVGSGPIFVVLVGSQQKFVDRQRWSDICSSVVSGMGFGCGLGWLFGWCLWEG